MSHNPNRTAAIYSGSGMRKQPYVPSVGEGVAHSDIMRRAGVGITLPASSTRKPTRFGFESEIFKGKDFIIRFEVLFPGNRTEYGFTEKADRHFRVVRGSAYVTYEETAGDRKVQHVKIGGFFTAKRGTKYAIATSGVEEVELMIVETPNYTKYWKTTEESVEKGNGGIPAVVENTVAPRNRDDSKEKQYALAQAEERSRKVPAKPGRKVNDASASFGVNLRPSGPGGYED